jgi:hypothetical protein
MEIEPWWKEAGFEDEKCPVCAHKMPEWKTSQRKYEHQMLNPCAKCQLMAADATVRRLRAGPWFCKQCTTQLPSRADLCDRCSILATVSNQYGSIHQYGSIRDCGPFAFPYSYVTVYNTSGIDYVLSIKPANTSVDKATSMD